MKARPPVGGFAFSQCIAFVLFSPRRREAASSRHSLFLVLGRRWWSWPDIGPRVFFSCVRNLFERRGFIARLEPSKSGSLAMFTALFAVSLRASV
jgi:hypothetical protein